jgi:energy-coupling factor transporter ATP-binding protein EcfA2
MIELQQLTKRYGDTLAVDGISATIPPGVVTGFLGPNGAGKSTTMRMILGLIGRLPEPRWSTAGRTSTPGLRWPRSARCWTPRPSTAAAVPATTCSRSVPRSASGRDA